MHDAVPFPAHGKRVQAITKLLQRFTNRPYGRLAASGLRRATPAHAETGHPSAGKTPPLGSIVPTENVRPVERQILLQRMIQSILNAEFLEAVPRRSPVWGAVRPKSHSRQALITRLGPVELHVPRLGAQPFATRIFARYLRIETSFLSALDAMVVRGTFSLQTLQAMATALCGHSFSLDTLGKISAEIDGELARYFRRQLEQEYPCCATRQRCE